MDQGEDDQEVTLEERQCKAESSIMQYSSSTDHRDAYLEQRQTEKLETGVRDVDKIRITKVYACFIGWHSGGHSNAPVRRKHAINPSLHLSTNNRRSAGLASSWCLLLITGLAALGG
jgi:hypothetical protein